jgi:ATP-binding cassette subfamily B (MDR/TAP) protein 1
MAFAFMALGAILFVTMSAQTTFMDTATIDMTHAMQRDWFEALLHQDMQYHDIRDSLLHQDMQYHDIRDSMGEATLISLNGNKYRKGVGKKMAAGVQFLMTFLGGMAYSFYASWRNLLMVLAVTPAMYTSALFMV